MFLLAVERDIVLCSDSELMSANTSCVSALFTRDQLLMSVTLVLLAHSSAAPCGSCSSEHEHTLCCGNCSHVMYQQHLSDLQCYSCVPCLQSNPNTICVMECLHDSRSYENEFGSSAIAGAL